MAIRYKYNNETYSSLYALRQAIWKHDNILYGNPTTQEEFDAIELLQGKVVFEEYDPWDELSEEQKASRMRSRRDSLLSESDFYVQSDYPSTPEGLEVVKTYRQALRDISNQETFPETVTWPEKPVVLLKEPEKTQAMSLNLMSVNI